MLFTEFNMEDAKEVWLEEGMKTGERKGREETIEYAAIEMIKKELDDDLIVEVLSISREKLAEIRARGKV